MAAIQTRPASSSNARCRFPLLYQNSRTQFSGLNALAAPTEPPDEDCRPRMAMCDFTTTSHDAWLGRPNARGPVPDAERKRHVVHHRISHGIPCGSRTVSTAINLRLGTAVCGPSLVIFCTLSSRPRTRPVTPATPSCTLAAGGARPAQRFAPLGWLTPVHLTALVVLHCVCMTPAVPPGT